MKKFLAVLLIASMSIGLVACGSSKETKDAAAEEQKEEAPAEQEEEEPAEETKEAAQEKGTLLMATTTSTADTGLLDYLAPIFLEDTGWKLEWTAVGTGEALKMGENGDVDVVLVHAKASEEEFIANGFGVERFPVMYNDFVIIGPEEEDAYGDDLEGCLKAIAEGELPFVSRGDDSGTDKKEKKLWPQFELDPTANPNYIESGQGMGATITMADEEQAYCLTDRGTWLKFKNDADMEIELNIVCEGAKGLLNQYGVIAVNPEKYPEVNNEAANAFIEWICSDEIQKLIGEYGVDQYGQALFTPNAGTDN